MPRKNSYSSGLADTVIDAGLAIKGDLASDNDILIDGTVEGSVTTGGNLSVGQSADIKGPLKARSIVIAGQVEGDVEAVEAVTLEATGHLEGDVETPQLGIAPGAYLHGKISMRTETETAAEE